jgi:chromate reductase, NAD(P)H dehydrogenase (quinone)
VELETRIIAISGSLRRQSFNTALLRAAASRMPAGAVLEVRLLHDVPLYNFDVEAEQGIPAAVENLKNDIAGADGVLLATPEYNNSVPGVLKNAIDWLSRPPKDIPRVFKDLPVAVMGASPGGFGTTLSQAAWLPVLRTLGTRYWTGSRMLVSRAGQAFDAQSALVDPEVGERLTAFLAGFVAFVREQPGRR